MLGEALEGLVYLQYCFQFIFILRRNPESRQNTVVVRSSRTVVGSVRARNGAV